MVSESSSETYVEESALSIKSGEEELRQWEGESSRPSQEEDEGQAKPRGNFGTFSNEHFFKELCPGIRDDQGKSCSPFMKEVNEKRGYMEGPEVGTPSVIACAEAYIGSPVHADLAKLVIDIEVSSLATPICNGLGQVGNKEAQPGMGWDQTLFGLEGGPRPDRETCGSEEGSRGYERGMQGALEEVHACNTDCNLHTEENWEGAIRVMKGAKDDKTEVYGSTEKDEPHRLGEGDVAQGGNLPRGHFTGMPSSPLHQRKEKGLTELGDSSLPQRRRSVRLHEKQARSAASKRHQEGNISASISDGDIFNCNSRLCEQGNGAEPAVLWEIGKTAGISCHGVEEEVVQEYACMEERDMEVASLAKTGDKDGLS